MTPVRIEPVALRSRVKHSTTEPLGSPGPMYGSGIPWPYSVAFEKDRKMLGSTYNVCRDVKLSNNPFSISSSLF